MSENTAALSGKWLRWVVCLLLHDARRSMTVAEIVGAVEDAGYTIAGERAGKTVSDALRWELGRGRVRQTGRGRYAAGLIQRSTEYSMRKRVETLWSLPPVVQTQPPLKPITLAPVDLPMTADGQIDFDALDTTDEWSGPAPAIVVDDWD